MDFLQFSPLSVGTCMGETEADSSVTNFYSSRTPEVTRACPVPDVT